MLNTTTMQGFKSAAKNLKKSLLEYKTDISLSSSQNLLAKALGAKNYNTIKAEIDKEKEKTNSINNELEMIVKDIKSLTTNSKQDPFVEHITEDFNFDYREYRNKNNYYLSFEDSREPRFIDEYPELGIVVSKLYFGSVRSLKREKLFIPLKLNEYGFAISPKEKEFSSLLNDMSPIETKLHEIKLSAIFKMKNATRFSTIELTIDVTENTKIIYIIHSEKIEEAIVHEGIKYKGFDNNIAKIKELSVKLGLNEKHPIQNCDLAIQAIKERENSLEDSYAEKEVSETLVKWLIENIKKGSLDAIEQFKVMALSSRGKADIDSGIFQSFFNTYKEKIKASKPIRFTFLADEAEMSKFDIVD